MYVLLQLVQGFWFSTGMKVGPAKIGSGVTVNILLYYYIACDKQKPGGPSADSLLLSKLTTTHIRSTQSAVVIRFITDQPQLSVGSVRHQTHSQLYVGTRCRQFERVWYVQLSFHSSINWEQSTMINYHVTALVLRQLWLLYLYSNYSTLLPVMSGPEKTWRGCVAWCTVPARLCAGSSAVCQLWDGRTDTHKKISILYNRLVVSGLQNSPANHPCSKLVLSQPMAGCPTGLCNGCSDACHAHFCDWQVSKQV